MLEREYPECPCGCLVRGPLTKRAPGHVRVLCNCRSCIGRRNRSNGQRAQRRTHQALGGIGRTPTNEEWGMHYEVDVQVESKSGAQIPANFAAFIGSKWFDKALTQAQAIAELSGRLAGVVINGKWLIVRLPK